MLISFSVTNFKSFKDEATLSMEVMDSIDLPSDYIVEDPSGIKLFKTAGLYGANASGKSNFIQGLSILRELVLESNKFNQLANYQEKKPTAFKLDDESDKQPSTFKIELLIDDIIYTYCVILSSKKVIEETLSYKQDSGLSQSAYIRKGQNFDFELFRNDPLKTQVFSDIIFEYQLCLSYANNFKDEHVNRVFNWFLKMFEFSPFYMISRYHAKRITEQEKYKKNLLKALFSAEFGIVDISTNELQFLKERKYYFNNEDIFIHYPNNKQLTLEDQSEGTKKFINLFDSVHLAIKNSSLLIVDEIEANLHPELCRHVIDLFNCNHGHKAQLLFTSHNYTLMDDKSLLRPDQVWIAERDEHLASRLVSPGEFDIPDWGKFSVRELYQDGRFGGYPNIGRLIP